MKTPKDKIIGGICIMILGSAAREFTGPLGSLIPLIGMALYCVGLSGVAQKRGHSGLWGLTGFLFIIGGLIVALLPKQKDTTEIAASDEASKPESGIKSALIGMYNASAGLYNLVILLGLAGAGLFAVFGTSTPKMEVRSQQNFFGTAVYITSEDDKPFTVTKIVVNGQYEAPAEVVLPLSGRKNQKDMKFNKKGDHYAYDIPSVDGRIVDVTIHTNRGKETYKFD